MLDWSGDSGRRDVKTVDSARLVALLVEAIKELNAKVEFCRRGCCAGGQCAMKLTPPTPEDVPVLEKWLSDKELLDLIRIDPPRPDMPD